MSEKNWLDSLSEILSKPLPGTDHKSSEVPPEAPVIVPDDEDDSSLLDRITDILTQPLPGTEKPEMESPAGQRKQGQAPLEPENPGEVAAQEAQKDNDDPVSSTATVGANWMQIEYQRFMAYQENARKAFADRQKWEHERFAAYQREQLDRLMRAQERERLVFQQHQQARTLAWQHDLRQNFGPPVGPPGTMPPPPPPPWWRGPRT